MIRRNVLAGRPDKAVDSTFVAPGADMFRDGDAEFLTTHWSVVLCAQGDSPLARDALEKLCRSYWRPLYAFVRREGYSPEEAEDLTQEFFARFLARKDFEAARREKGRAALLPACFSEKLSRERASSSGCDQTWERRSAFFPRRDSGKRTLRLGASGKAHGERFTSAAGQTQSSTRCLRNWRKNIAQRKSFPCSSD